MGALFRALALGLLAVSNGLRLVAQNRSLYLDGKGPHFFRAIQYSPTPWGIDSDIALKTDYYRSEWPALFERDLRLMSLMGVNAVKLTSSFGSPANSGPHTAFLDAAFRSNISVFLSYDLKSDTSRLDTTIGLAAAVRTFKTTLLRAEHEAIIMVFLGDSINRFTAGFVCNVPRDALGFATNLPCQFGEDVTSFAATLERLCKEAQFLGLSCTVPLANVPLPLATQVARYGPLSLRPSRGVIDWLDIMAAEMPSMDVLSASLTASSASSAPSSITFELELDQLPSHLPSRPFIVAEYGIDAFNSTEWLMQAGVWYDKSFPLPFRDREVVGPEGRMYKLTTTGDVPSAEDEDAQATWLVALARELEREATSCREGCGSGRAVSGGVLRSWSDEWWRASSPADDIWHGGNLGLCVASDECFAMSQLCPPRVPGVASQRSICGAPFPGLQPDGFVNEEWFGVVAYERSCDCVRNPANISACAAHLLVPHVRAAYYALQAVWNPDTAAVSLAQSAFADADTGALTTDCDNISSTWACQLFPQAPRLQRRPGSPELYLDCQLFLMRGISYSPAPFGDASKGVIGADPGYAEPWGDYFTEEWHDLFRRDIAQMHKMGANAIRLYTLKTSVRHATFFDLAYENNLTVIASFEIGAAQKTPMASIKDLAVVKARLRLQIRSSIHPAIIFWMVGNELNGASLPHFFSPPLQHTLTLISAYDTAHQSHAAELLGIG
ncbi:hypothetical protein AB1Y20_001054 [Prymnesium parvum]|uniref:Beta-galactosidase n=1 Tax=Prymnesium parvum TaxID=97485 RepID=A0AB34KA71_PRYPA